MCAEAARVDFPSFNLVQVGPKEVAGVRESRSGLRKETSAEQTELGAVWAKGKHQKIVLHFNCPRIGKFKIQYLTVSVC